MSTKVLHVYILGQYLQNVKRVLMGFIWKSGLRLPYQVNGVSVARTDETVVVYRFIGDGPSLKLYILVIIANRFVDDRVLSYMVSWYFVLCGS